MKPSNDGIIFLTRQESRALFDERCRALMGIGAEEFLRRLDAGEYREIEDTPAPHGFDVVELSMLRSWWREGESQ